MNVYVETNFALELVFQQEQHASCEQILHLCNEKQVQLLMPAYSLAEPHEKLHRQNSNRQELQRVLNAELRQLARTASFATRIRSIREIETLLVQSTEEERARFDLYRMQLVNNATIISLTAQTLVQAADLETQFDLGPQDAIVLASVLDHLGQREQGVSCFLNRNFRDFDNPFIVDELNGYSCKMLPRFDSGLAFIQSQLANN